MGCGCRVLWKYLNAFEKVVLCMLGIAFTVAPEERRQSPPSALYFVSSVYNSHDGQARDSEREILQSPGGIGSRCSNNSVCTMSVYLDRAPWQRI
jgi:hypothetical protein